MADSRALQGVIGYAPSMLDLNIRSRVSATEYVGALSEIGVRPGEWSTVSSFDRLDALVSKVGGTSIENVVKLGGGTEVGASILGSFAAFNPLYAGKRALRLTIGVDAGGNPDVFASSVLERIGQLGIETTSFPCVGRTDLCVATYHKAIPDRTMFVYQGQQPPTVPFTFADDFATLHFLSAFEIARGFFAFDAEVLRRNQSCLAIGLGDRKLMTPRLVPIIKKQMRENSLRYLIGEISEYKQLFRNRSRAPAEDVVKVVEACSRRYATIFLLTAGATGIYGIAGGKVHFAPAHNVVGLVNTNGAGDAAAGGFLSTHLLTSDVPTSLSYALQRAEELLTSPARRVTVS